MAARRFARRCPKCRVVMYTVRLSRIARPSRLSTNCNRAAPALSVLMVMTTWPAMSDSTCTGARYCCRFWPSASPACPSALPSTSNMATSSAEEVSTKRCREADALSRSPVSRALLMRVAICRASADPYSSCCCSCICRVEIAARVTRARLTSRHRPALTIASCWPRPLLSRGFFNEFNRIETGASINQTRLRGRLFGWCA